ncbi:type II toxin-antitoxin system VapC family toxin [Candidatus Poribacteria bacterium]|nr:type II toxin-antitoxin system VapC family toxin [Candidatus Poribacteria bacterium]MYH80752.1 type II toxin-antitoxin system VapC family toxin [Candidatus Poribacteria bacterium]MYK93177.1 type II toxin-antitoxin system VapC family toxin [Candidatus Poribacteria bacterium]
MNNYLLDTSTCSLLMQDNSRVKGRFDSLTESDYYFTCPIVKGEILFGIGRLPQGKRRQDLEQRANELFATVQCDSIPDTVAPVYAQIKTALQQQGMSLSECDLWIAATALALDAILVASDSDYERIIGLGLRLEDWKN